MVDKKLFNKLKKDYEEYDIGRRIVIKNSQDILKFSKQSIFALHRGNTKDAENLLQDAEKQLDYLLTKMKGRKGLEYEGSYLAAIEEFVEANLFYQFITTGNVGPIKKFKIRENSYLGGMSDLTGEIVRRAVYLATKRRYEDIQACYDAIQAIVGELIKFNLTGQLRSKFDQSKNSLRKIEEIMYDLEIKRRN